MAHKKQLRALREGTVINVTSKKQEKSVIKALQTVEADLKDRYGVILVHLSNWYLHEIVSGLKGSFPDIDFYYEQDTSHIRPDGGVLAVEAKSGKSYPILISEVKHQGTNDLRMREGKSKQAMGNAIERLGKNVIGIRTAMLNEGICPFVCFGYGYDFKEGSSIRDRVVTIAMFGELNKTYLHNQGPDGRFGRGSFYFRQREWKPEEMAEIMEDIAERSLLYYFSKYGKDQFVDESNRARISNR